LTRAHRFPGDRIWQVRMSLHEFQIVGIHEYQRVRLNIPQECEMSLYLRGRRENPPFLWLKFGFDVRRLSA
jgi:hypothetical protein